MKFNVQALATFTIEADTPEEAAEQVEAGGGDLNAVQDIERVYDEDGVEVEWLP